MQYSKENPPRTGLVDVRKLDPVLKLKLLDPRFDTTLGRSLPPELSFEWCSPALKELSRESRLVSKPGASDKLDEDNPLRGVLPPDVIDVLENGFEPLVPGERGRAIYFIPESEEMDCTPIVHGEYDHVKHLPLKEEWKYGIPIVRAHTHPEDGLFSPQDYKGLITQFISRFNSDSTKGLNPSIRELQAEIVICPSNQLVAFPTALTPLLSAGEVDDLMDKRVAQWGREADEEYSQQPEPYIPMTDEQFVAVIKQHTPQVIAFIRGLKDRVNKGLLTSRAINMETAAFFSSLGPELKKEMENDQRDKALRKRIWNGKLMELARDLHLQLYMSTDFVNFKAFSA